MQIIFLSTNLENLGGYSQNFLRKFVRFFLSLEVAGEIHELTNLWNLGNKIQEIREHICEIAEIFFRLFIHKKWQITEIVIIEKYPKLLVLDTLCLSETICNQNFYRKMNSNLLKLSFW